MSKPLYRYADFLAAMRGRPFNAGPDEVTGVSIDSRTVAPGDAFFAIKGDRFDGHSYVGQALGAGAATAVVCEAKLPALGRITGSLTVVSDVLEALGGLARAARQRAEAAIIAVTGSVGKTTTKEMLLHILSRQGATHGAAASFNNHWGVPLTLARLPQDARFGVFEIGMNHAGEITPLVQMIRPHVAIITNVEAVHLAHFADVAAIARAKAEIFSGIEPGGAAVINRDNPQSGLLLELARAAGVSRIATFGADPAADARLNEVVLGPQSSVVAADIFGTELTYELGAPGRHIVDNSLAALAAVATVGGDLPAAAAALCDMAAVKGRGARRRLALAGGTVELIDESYNANPASMRAAIAVLGQAQTGGGGRRIAVLGDMLELGPAELELHAGLAEPLRAAGIDRVFLAGPLMAALRAALPGDGNAVHTATAADLLAPLVETLRPGDVVMVKGSNGSKMGPLVEALADRFAGPTRPAGAILTGPESPRHRGAA